MDEKTKQFKRTVSGMNRLLKGPTGFSNNGAEIGRKLATLCELYYGYVPSTIMPDYAKDK